MLFYATPLYLFSFFFNDTATTEIYTLSLHDALPISLRPERGAVQRIDWAGSADLIPSSSSILSGSPSRCCWTRESRDRKSTRLNSSHSQISYAVFCLKKKKKKKNINININKKEIVYK